MLLHYVNRSTYRDKYSGKLLEELKNRFGNFYLIPEGGSNELAIKGCGEILNDIEIDFNYVCTACGTAGTIAGIISTLNKNSAAIGFSVLKSASFLNDNVNTLLGKINLIDRSRWRINLDYHFGGYAKIDQALVKFIDDFQSSHNIQLDPVYTGKMMFGIFDLIRNDFFSKGSTIIAIHTGGLQGIDGMKSKIDRIRDYNSHQLF
jgi:1-aminocyclopropane-1-carboxylate deaminase